MTHHIAIAITVFVAGFGSIGRAQPPAPHPAAPAATNAVSLLHEAVGMLSQHALGAERVDWAALERELSSSLHDSDPPAKAHPAIQAAVARLNDPHARFTPAAPPVVPAAAPADSTNHSTSPAPPPPTPKHPPVPVVPEGRMLDDHVAYLIVPGCAAPDVEGLRTYARAAAFELNRLAAQSPRGWVIDLRLNGGGNLWPMLLGLRPLLGDGPQMTMVKGDRAESRFGVSAENAWIDWGNGPEAQLNWGATAAPESMPRFTGRVAVLLGSWTMSSGEALAICFAGRAQSKTFGEETAGLTTVTNFYPLSDGSMLNLPVSRMGDREGRAYVGKLKPQQSVSFGDWPLADDAAARAARDWAAN